MRPQVSALSALGPLPDDDAEVEVIDLYAGLLAEIAPPVTDEEAEVLVHLFGPSDCYGLAWTLLHLIESAPGWPLEDYLEQTENEWIVCLKTRIENSRRWHRKDG